MHLTLHLTKDCNLRCTYCFAAPFTRHAMSQAVGERALEFGAELGNGECNVIFFGGEPLLCKERIRALIAHARQLEAASANGAGDDGKPTRRRFSFRISTNGTLLDDETLAYFMRENVHVALSIDGCREAHDTHRRTTGGEGTFDTVVERLAALLAVRPYSPVQMVVRPDTVKYVTQSVEFLLDEGVRYLLMSLDYTADWTEAHMRVLEREYRKLARRYIRWTEAGRKFYFSPFEQKLASHIHNGCTRTDRCEMARQQLSVDIDGNIFPCVQFPNAGADSEYCLGSIFTGLKSQRRHELQGCADGVKESCKGCALTDRCTHTCGCLNWKTTGDVNTVSPVVCHHEQMLMPIADRVGEILYKRRNPLFLHKHYNPGYPILSAIEDVLEARRK